MLVSEFLALVPGPKALVGALIQSRLPIDKERKTLRVSSFESIDSIITALGSWRIIENPPRYQDPTARYCAWCETRLYTGYNPGLGLVDGWCPDHGVGAKVLHEPDAKEKRHIDTLQKVKNLEPQLERKNFEPQFESKLGDTVPGLAALGIPRKTLEAMVKASPSSTVVQVTQARTELLRKLGFGSIEEFKQLAGVKS